MSYSVPDMLQSFGGCFVSFSGRNFESVVESFGVSAGFFGVVVRIWFWLCRLWGWAKKGRRMFCQSSSLVGCLLAGRLWWLSCFFLCILGMACDGRCVSVVGGLSYCF